MIDMERRVYFNEKAMSQSLNLEPGFRQMHIHGCQRLLCHKKVRKAFIFLNRMYANIKEINFFCFC